MKTLLSRMLLVAFVAYAAAAAAAAEHQPEVTQGTVIELGVDNFASTIQAKPWTAVLFYDGNDEKQQGGYTYYQKLMSGLLELEKQQLLPTSTTFAMLNVRKHPYYREAYQLSSDPDPMISDFYHDFPSDASSVFAVSHRTFMNLNGDLYFPPKLVLLGYDLNVYGQVDINQITANTEMQVAILQHWMGRTTGGKLPENKTAVIESHIHREKQRDQDAQELDNSFPFEAYFEDKAMNDVIEKDSAAQKERFLLENEAKEDANSIDTNNNITYYQQARMNLHDPQQNAEAWWESLSQVTKAYLVTVEGYETLWEEERKAREDQQTEFGKHLETLNHNMRQVIDSIFHNESYVPPISTNPVTALSSEEARNSNEEAEQNKRQIPHALKGYLEELVFGAGRSPTSLRMYLEQVRISLGATPEERRQKRHTIDATQFVLFERMKDYMKLVEDTDRNPDLYVYTLADLTSRWNNLLVDFHDHLHASYANYLETNPLPKDDQGKIIFQRKPVEVIDMKDPNNYDLLTNYEAFHSQYTQTATPVILGNVNMTIRQEFTLDYLQQVCGSMDVTKKVVESNPVGGTFGSGWGGLEDFVLPNELLNPQRRGIVEKDSSDDDDDDDDVDLTYADRTLTFQQFVTLQSKLDNIYLHDYSLAKNCGKVLYENTLYDSYENQKFQIPSIVASYDIFHRIPLYGFAGTWPSLFVGKKGSNSKIHVDSGASGFFMYLVSGRKRWIVTKPAERPFLYELIQNFASMTPDVLGIDKNADANEFLSKRFPLLHRASEEMYEVIQEPGQLIYIPPDSPHAAENLEDIVGIALNLTPRDAFASHLHDQIHFERGFGYSELALKYWLFEDNADLPITGKDSLYMTFAEYKGQF